MEELFQAFPRLLQRFEENDEVLSSFVFAAWRRAAGEALSERAVPVAFSRKRLLLTVENETWRHHLEALSGQMIRKLNEALGHGIVTFIEFRVDRSNRDRKPPSSHQTNAGGSPIVTAELAGRVELEKAAATITDDDMRSRFVEAAEAYLTRQASADTADP